MSQHYKQGVPLNGYRNLWVTIENNKLKKIKIGDTVNILNDITKLQTI